MQRQTFSNILRILPLKLPQLTGIFVMVFSCIVLLYLRGEEDHKRKADLEEIVFQKAIPLAIAFFIWHISLVVSRIEGRLDTKQ